MPEAVGVGIAGHLGPVYPADVFTPADDLAHEALGRGERIALWIPRMGVGRGLRDFHRRK